jgi:shikimate dehydrogenase
VKRFGLIGKTLSHSFSQRYFTEKFARLNLADYTYHLFEILDIAQLGLLVEQNPDLMGFNVTIPYKEAVLPFLTGIDDKAQKIGAVNTVVRKGAGKWQGFNTDYFGFSRSLQNHCKLHQHQKALVLGTGGASKAVVLALQDLGLHVQQVSRNPSPIAIDYQTITQELMREHTLVVNTTPLGMYPAIDTCPPLPYAWMDSAHFCMDLVYNPESTVFLQKSQRQGAATLGGLEMLHLQADKAWEYFEQAW